MCPGPAIVSIGAGQPIAFKVVPFIVLGLALDEVITGSRWRSFSPKRKH